MSMFMSSNIPQTIERNNGFIDHPLTAQTQQVHIR